MDQFAIGMGRKNYAIKLNINSLEYEYALADLKKYAILIMNTNKLNGKGLAGLKRFITTL